MGTMARTWTHVKREGDSQRMHPCGMQLDSCGTHLDPCGRQRGRLHTHGLMWYTLGPMWHALGPMWHAPGPMRYARGIIAHLVFPLFEFAHVDSSFKAPPFHSPRRRETDDALLARGLKEKETCQDTKEWHVIPNNYDNDDYTFIRCAIMRQMMRFLPVHARKANLSGHEVVGWDYSFLTNSYIGTGTL